MENRTTVVRAAAGTSHGLRGTAAAGTGDATNVIAQPWYLLLLVRVGRVYGQALVGLITMNGIGALPLEAGLEMVTGEEWTKLGAAAYTALAPSVATLIMNGVEYITNLDSKWATFHG